LFQVRIHGRGGQGVVTAAELLSAAFDFCKGCGICVTECPCGSIEMVPEEI
jgi:Pyruvate/2-oxoacid:ferredoxin oxidoreductase delta subunit